VVHVIARHVLYNNLLDFFLSDVPNSRNHGRQKKGALFRQPCHDRILFKKKNFFFIICETFFILYVNFRSFE